jgi:hypothetical protein
VERQKNSVKAAGTLESESFFSETEKERGQKRLILCVSVTVTRALGVQRAGEPSRLQSITRQYDSASLVLIRFKSHYYLWGQQG